VSWLAGECWLRRSGGLPCRIFQLAAALDAELKTILDYPAVAADAEAYNKGTVLVWGAPRRTLTLSACRFLCAMA
jgi:hypothetical protein